MARQDTYVTMGNQKPVVRTKPTNMATPKSDKKVVSDTEYAIEVAGLYAEEEDAVGSEQRAMNNYYVSNDPKYSAMPKAEQDMKVAAVLMSTDTSAFYKAEKMRQAKLITASSNGGTL
tara:strand:- start:1680 stop:2033 length:354 start_codon:yes stop_codon:yes gene_type:complete